MGFVYTVPPMVKVMINYVLTLMKDEVFKLVGKFERCPHT